MKKYVKLILLISLMAFVVLLVFCKKSPKKESDVPEETYEHMTFLYENGILTKEEINKPSDNITIGECSAIISRLAGCEEEASSYDKQNNLKKIKDNEYSSYFHWAEENKILENTEGKQCGDNVTQFDFLSMLIRSLGDEISNDGVMKDAQRMGIVKNIPISSYNEYTINRNIMSAYIYNALSSKCEDGNMLCERLGISLPEVTQYEPSYIAQTSSSSSDGTSAKAVSKTRTEYVSLNDIYNDYELTTYIKTEKTSSLIIGLRNKNQKSTFGSDGVWLSFENGGYRITKGEDERFIEMPLGLVDINDGTTIKIVDGGTEINIYIVIGDAQIPITELRFVDDYIVAYVRGHIVQSLPSEKIQDSGYVIFGSKDGTVELDDLTVTSIDRTYYRKTLFPVIAEETEGSVYENFENGIYDYNVFYATGGGLNVVDGRLEFKSNGRENIFSTIMRLKNSVLEADVIESKGELEIQTAAASNTSAGYYYCGMDFKISKSSIELYHCTRNMDENAMQDNYKRAHGLDLSKGYRVRLTNCDGTMSLYIQPFGAEDYTEVMRLVLKTETLVHDGVSYENTYYSVLDKNFEKEVAHYDKMTRDAGYLRIVSQADTVIDNVAISGTPYLPLEQEDLKEVPEPDKDMKFDIADKKTVVGMGYLPYFTRYKPNGKPAERPSVEDLIQPVLDALSSSNPTNSLNKLYWGYAWWATPAQGMYCSRDKWATKNNMRMIAEAGVDFIYIDHTNFAGGCTPDDVFTNIQLILDCIVELQDEGEAWPRVAFWANTKTDSGRGLEDTPKELWNFFLSDPKYKNIWVYYNKKPLMMYTFSQPMPYDVMYDAAEIREMWTKSNTPNTWVFHQDPNELSTRGGQDAKGKYEELDVLCYGYTTYIGNINNLPNVLREQKDGREGGLYYQKYWKKAFDTRPKVVLIWAYNHWDVNFNKPDAKGMVSWHDNFNTNYSGGLEPIKNDFVYRGTSYPGDSYYVWTKQYIEAYKNNKDMPMDLFVKGSY